jgi:hypothetical protein
MVLLPQKNLQVTASDMTLLLGAESWLTRRTKTRLYSWESQQDRRTYPFDPKGRDCLRDFIDLVVNSEVMYFTLPHEDQSHVPILVVELAKYLRSLPKAAIDLPPEIEENVFSGFIDLAEHRGADWIWKWTKFQLENPLVYLGHSGRISGIITEGGYQVWRDNFGQLLQSNLLRIGFDIDPPQYLAEYINQARDKFDSHREFFVCYAFDVYRRGWQYMRSVSECDARATYFPHLLRNDALESGTSGWQQLHQCQQLLWSWGEYIVQLIEEPAYENLLTPEKVAEYVHRIREILRPSRDDNRYCPRWFEVATVNEIDRIEFLEDTETLRDCIEQTALEAGLPLLETIRRKNGLSKKRNFVDEAVLRGVPLVYSDMKSLDIPLSRISAGRTSANLCWKGMFAHRGLIPKTSLLPQPEVSTLDFFYGVDNAQQHNDSRPVQFIIQEMIMNKEGDTYHVGQAGAVGKYARSDNNDFFQSEQKQTLAQAAAEIQQLLSHLSETEYISEVDFVNAVHQEIKKNPTLKARLVNALKSGGLEALKAIFNHPVFSIPAETVKGWLEAE